MKPVRAHNKDALNTGQFLCLARAQLCRETIVSVDIIIDLLPAHLGKRLVMLRSQIGYVIDHSTAVRVDLFTFLRFGGFQPLDVAFIGNHRVIQHLDDVNPIGALFKRFPAFQPRTILCRGRRYS